MHASGLDRLWMVNDVAEKVIECGGNVAESKASKLGQYFSMMMLVEVPREHVHELHTAMSVFPDMNVAVFEVSKTDALVTRVACEYDVPRCWGCQGVQPVWMQRHESGQD